MSTITLEDIYKQRDFLKEKLKRYEAYERLQDNEDFKELILKGYFREEADRVIGMLSDDSKSASIDMTETDRKHYVEMLIGISRLRDFFRTLKQVDNMIRKELHNLEETENDLLKEQEIK